MSIFFKGEEKIREMILEYLDTVDACMKCFQGAILKCLADGENKLLPNTDETHELEAKADDLMREIDITLFGRTLLPESRVDIMILLDSIDKIPNAAETVLRAMENQRIIIPDKFRSGFRELVEISVESSRLLRRTANTLFDNPQMTLMAAGKVDNQESASDGKEKQLVCDIFDSDIEKADKILLKSIVDQIGAISDRAESAADRLGLTAIKRRI